MDRLLIIALLLAPVGASADWFSSGDDWSKVDIAREATWQAFNLIDRQQTLDIPNHPDLREANSMIDPTDRAGTNRYFAVLAVGHWAVSHKLNSRWRGRWQTGSLIFTGLVVLHNREMGLRFRF